MGQAPEDLTVFYAREYPRIVGALDLYCGDLHVAEEMAQEALARVCRDWHRVREMGSPGGWAHRVAMNLVNSHYRRRRIRRRVERRLRDEQATGAQDWTAEDTGRNETVRTAIRQLPEAQRTAVVLHYYLGHPLAEIGEMMGWPLGTVKSHLHRARRALQDLLSEHEIEEVSDVH